MAFPRFPCSWESGFKLVATIRCTEAVSGGKVKGVLHAVLALAGDQCECFCSLTQCAATSSMGVMAWGWGGRASPILGLEFWWCVLDFLSFVYWASILCHPDCGSSPAGQVQLQSSDRHC